MPPGLIELDHICEQQPRIHRSKRLSDESVRVGVGRRVLAGDVAAGEQVIHLADSHPRHTGFGQPVQQRGTYRLDRVIPPMVGNSRKRTGLPHERPRDHPRHRVRAGEDLPSLPRSRVELVERYLLLVSSDLKDAVARCVHNPGARVEVLRAVLLDDLGPRCGLVPQHPSTRGRLELRNDFGWEAVGIQRKRFLQQYSAELPMTCRGVLSFRVRYRHPVRGGRVIAPQTTQRPATPQTQRLEVRKPKATHYPRRVGQGVASRVPIFRRVRCLADANTIQHDQRYTTSVGDVHGPR